MDFQLVFEDVHITELAQFCHRLDDPMLVSLVVLGGEHRHPAVSTVVSLLVPRVPLRCQVTGEVSQPGGSGVELKKERCQWRSVVSQPKPTLAGQ